MNVLFITRVLMVYTVVVGLSVTAFAYASHAADERQRTTAQENAAQENATREKNSVEQRSATPALARTPQPVLTTQQEDQALAFAHEHHRELADLLVQLRRSSSVGFSGGVRDVYSVTQRLERIREKQPERFEYELTDWKLGSEIRLLTARWVMSQDPALETQIRSLLKERQQARLERLQSERTKVAERLENMDHQIAAAEADLNQNMAAEWTRLAGQAKGAHKPSARQSRKSGPVATSKPLAATVKAATETKTESSQKMKSSVTNSPASSGSKKQAER